jgi:hypothetical protein
MASDMSDVLDDVECWAERLGAAGLAVEMRQVFLAGCGLLGLAPPDEGAPVGWLGAAEHALSLRGDVSVRQGGEGLKAAYLEVAGLPADAPIADPRYDPAWEAALLLAHGALLADRDEGPVVHERARDYVLAQKKR